MDSHSYWYIGLILISIILFFYVYSRKRGIHTVILFFIMVELAFLIETVIFIFLDCYVYYPHIITWDAYYDSLFGSLCSNLMIIPSLAILVGTLQLRYLWIIFITGLLAIVEWHFSRIGIYALHWWRIEYTSAGLLLVYFPACKLLYRKLVHPLRGGLHFIFLFLGIASIVGTLGILPIIFLGNRNYTPGWFGSMSRDTIAFGSIYYVAAAILITLLARAAWRRRWLKYGLLAAVLYAVTILLIKLQLLRSYTLWDPWYYILAPLPCLWIAERMSRALYKGQNWMKN